MTTYKPTTAPRLAVTNGTTFDDVMTFIRGCGDRTLSTLISVAQAEETARIDATLAQFPTVNDTEDGYVRTGRMVEAVKSYRDRTGVALSTALRLMRRHETTIKY